MGQSAVESHVNLRSDAPPIAGWTTISSRDAFVYRSRKFAFKVARPGQEHRVINGVNVARHFVGLPVLQPEMPGLVNIDGQIGSLWRWIAGAPQWPDTIALYRAVSDANLHPTGIAAFDPAAIIASRLPTITAEHRRIIDPYLDRALRHIELSGQLPTRLQHGDASLENAVGRGTKAVLIDLDSARMLPDGWDRACLDYTAAFNDLDPHHELWPPENAGILLPIKWAMSLAWNLARGFVPPTIRMADTFRWIR